MNISVKFMSSLRCGCQSSSIQHSQTVLFGYYSQYDETLQERTNFLKTFYFHFTFCTTVLKLFKEKAQ